MRNYVIDCIHLFCIAKDNLNIQTGNHIIYGSPPPFCESFLCANVQVDKILGGYIYMKNLPHP